MPYCIGDLKGDAGLENCPYDADDYYCYYYCVMIIMISIVITSRIIMVSMITVDTNASIVVIPTTPSYLCCYCDSAIIGLSASM